MDHTAYTETQCLYKGALYFYLTFYDRLAFVHCDISHFEKTCNLKVCGNVSSTAYYISACILCCVYSACDMRPQYVYSLAVVVTNRSLTNPSS